MNNEELKALKNLVAAYGTATVLAAINTDLKAAINDAPDDSETVGAWETVHDLIGNAIVIAHAAEAKE